MSNHRIILTLVKKQLEKTQLLNMLGDQVF